MIAPKPRVRVNTAGKVTGLNGQSITHDSFQNFAASVGIGTANLSTASNYGFNPISRNHTLMEWAYRGSFIVRKIVDVVAEDMTRAKIQVTSDEDPDTLEKLDQYWNRLLIWKRLCETIKWARLYGGCIAVMMIDGQRPEDPFDVESVGLNSFRGLLCLDRWMLWADLANPVTDFGVDFGTPKYYVTNSDARSIPTMRIHHSRCIRLEGIALPYWQRIAENDWGLSVLEPMWDRIVAFDSTTQGAAQLVYKAHIRVYAIERLREIIAAGGKSYQALIKQTEMIRLMQSNEGLTLLDASDRYETNDYAFGGLSDVLAQFAQQLSGAADIPLTRLFGQTPAGLNATGESDLRNYYDMINARQEESLRRGIETLRSVTYRSRFGKAPQAGETFEFTSLYKMTDAEKASTASTIMNTAVAGIESGLLTPMAGMKEIKQWSRVTGFGTNITETEIENASESDPPSLKDLTGNLLDNPIDEIRFRHGLKTDDDTDAGEQLGEEEVTGGKEDGEGLGTGREDNYAPVAAPGNILGDAVPQPPGSTHTRDRRSVLDVHGLTVVIETAKGEARTGRGWRVSMPAHYGYFSGTGSAEGSAEQMDCYVGDDHTSQRIYVIHQIDPATGEFDEHKVMAYFPNISTAIDVYHRAFSDGSGPSRINKVDTMTVPQFKAWLNEWSYGLPGKVDRDDLYEAADLDEESLA